MIHEEIYANKGDALVLLYYYSDRAVDYIDEENDLEFEDLIENEDYLYLTVTIENVSIQDYKVFFECEIVNSMYPHPCKIPQDKLEVHTVTVDDICFEATSELQSQLMVHQ